MEKNYVDTGKVRYIYRPFGADFTKDRTARLAAESLYCAGEQGKFWEMHSWMYANVDRWSSAGDVVSALVESAAPELGLDGAVLGNCLRRERFSGLVQRFEQDALARGVTGTPTFLINGRQLFGFRTFDEFSAIIEEELRK